MKIEKNVIKAYKLMMRALANENRLDILYSLYKKPKTWTDLLFELKMNPKSLRDHLNYLKKSGLIRKRKSKGFELTDAAKAFIQACYSKKTKHIIYNIGGEEKTIKEVAEIVKTILPDAIVEVQDGYGRFVPLPSIDTTLSQAELSYRPSYTLHQGIQEYVNYISKVCRKA